MFFHFWSSRSGYALHIFILLLSRFETLIKTLLYFYIRNKEFDYCHPPCSVFLSPFWINLICSSFLSSTSIVYSHIENYIFPVFSGLCSADPSSHFCIPRGGGGYSFLYWISSSRSSLVNEENETCSPPMISSARFSFFSWSC